jgi:hypothetical protein
MSFAEVPLGGRCGGVDALKPASLYGCRERHDRRERRVGIKIRKEGRGRRVTCTRGRSVLQVYDLGAS